MTTSASVQSTAATLPPLPARAVVARAVLLLCVAAALAAGFLATGGTAGASAVA